jgi:hypothetical protein
VLEPVAGSPVGGGSLLSLIPYLIERASLVGDGVWVWLGGTLVLLGFGHGPVLCGRRLGTLLGPEKTSCGVLSLVRSGSFCPNASVCVRGGGVGIWVWLCVECCIVDASILFVVKCVRAHGGCLGIRSR